VEEIQMKILYYDCFSGISGDMNVGALLDLGVDRDYLVGELSKLNLNHEFKINIKRDIRKGIEGTKFKVVLNEHEYDHDDRIHEEKGHMHHQGEEHNHSHKHDHNHKHVNHQVPAHHHEHRNLKDISDIIYQSDLSENVKALSIKIFTKVAEAEAKIHGKPLDKVHFHEVGAIDSIVDIVGAAVCIDYLKVDKIMCSTVELGGGFVRCAHGLFPVPAPATLEILKGVPVKSGIVPFETTTPTGGAILAAVVDEFTDNKNFIIDKIGYGVGGRDTEIPNVLRVMLAHK
jgi:pyridinium-3,5-bisthiocarboxylic acid mononucleotide nickel chelatase